MTNEAFVLENGLIFVPQFNKVVLGLDLLSKINECFLTKLAWRIVANPSSLLSRLFDAKYNKGKGWWSRGNIIAPTVCTACEAWRGIRVGLKNLVNQLRWVVGNGRKVNLIFIFFSIVLPVQLFGLLF